MKSVKCIHCGLVNWADAEGCKRCGNPPQGAAQEDFGGWGPEANYYWPQGDGKQRKGLAVASLVLGVLSFFTFGLLGVGALTGLIMGIVALSRASKQPEVYGGRGLAIGGIVMNSVSTVLIVPVAIIAAIAIPNLLAARRAANEASAVRGVRELLVAESVFYANQREYGPLEKVVLARIIQPENPLAGGLMNGYRFQVAVAGETCYVSAVPQRYGSTGRRSFYADCGDGEIHFADKGGLAADETDPVLDDRRPAAGGGGFGPDYDGHGAPRRVSTSGY